MKLNNQVTVTLSDNRTLSLNEFSPSWIDDTERKLVLARLHPAVRPFVLWKGEEYDAAGDWTQAQAEARVMEFLGDNAQEKIQSMVIA